MDKKEIREKVSEGWIHSRIIIEILGKPKEHVEKTLRHYVEQIKENTKKVGIIDVFYSEPEAQGEKKELFSIFAELELVAKGPETLIWLCFDYMPSSIEIIDPEQLRYKKADFAGLINDLLARLHDVDMKYKNLVVENNLINRSNEIVLRKLIVLSLKQGPKNLDKIAEEVDMDAKPLLMFLGTLIEAEIIKKEGDKFMLAE